MTHKSGIESCTIDVGICNPNVLTARAWLLVFFMLSAATEAGGRLLTPAPTPLCQQAPHPVGCRCQHQWDCRSGKCSGDPEPQCVPPTPTCNASMVPSTASTACGCINALYTTWWGQACSDTRCFNGNVMWHDAACVHATIDFMSLTNSTQFNLDVESLYEHRSNPDALANLCPGCKHCLIPSICPSCSAV